VMAGAVGERLWLITRGFTSSLLHQDMLRDSGRYDRMILEEVAARGFAVNRAAAMADCERILAIPRVWAVVTDIVGELREHGRLDAEAVQTVMGRHGVGTALRDAGVSVW
ncbi:hypothetical protein, partial [Marinitenerispora sediminis]